MTPTLADELELERVRKARIHPQVLQYIANVSYAKLEMIEGDLYRYLIGGPGRPSHDPVYALYSAVCEERGFRDATEGRPL